MYNYYADIVWAINWVLFICLISAAIIIFLCAVFRKHLREKRRNGLLEIKKDVYEMVLSGKGPSEAVCQPFAVEATPQQFLDIETNRSIDAAFFNDSERQLFKACFITPGQIVRLTRIAKRSIIKRRRIEAMLSLGYTQTESAIDTLKGPLLSCDKDTAYFAMISLGQIKTAASAKVLLDFLRKEPSGGYKIASVLEGFPEDIADDVIKLADDSNPLTRFWAVTILSKLNPLKHIRKIEALAMDPKDEVRAAACDCLGNMGAEETAHALVKRLKDDSWLVKRRAIFALEKVMGDRALPDVIGLINNASWSVVDAVKDVMTKHIKASLPYIEKFIAGKDCIPKKYSAMALKTGLKDLDPHTKAKAMKILAGTGGGE